jgi:uncharacterized protein (UPF0297 family)
MILSDQQALDLVKLNRASNREFEKLREDSSMLYALVEGDDFTEKLIDKIEFIEGEKKAIARKKYSRDIQDFFERLFQPLENIWYATGGNKVYDIDDLEVKKEFLHTISNIKDSNTLSHWIQNVGIGLSHVDPNGLMFMEYTTIGRKEIYPTYKSINDIRAYKKRGQLLEWVIFEPTKARIKELDVQLWRIVDDVMDRTFVEIGQEFYLSEEMSFKHPFGEVPALLNSNVTKTGMDYRISPIHSIIGLTKEYSRDQSIKTIYKFTQGFPIHWRYVTECDECKGRGNIDGESCGSCDGKGYLTKGDVTDMVTLPVPTADQPTIAPNIAGHIKPDNETWTQYTTELNEQERKAFLTFWGTLLSSEENLASRKTTTEVMFNKQPIENRLNKYADYGEFIEWKMSEWILNFIDVAKDRKENRITITYGRDYVIEPSDTILKRYEDARNNQENDVIMDELFKQYLQATYRTNPIELAKNMIKSEIEPYLHQSLKDVIDVFGQEEAQRKVLFSKWWSKLNKSDIQKDKELLINEYDAWFELNKKEIKVAEQPSVNLKQ